MGNIFVYLNGLRFKFGELKIRNSAIYIFLYIL